MAHHGNGELENAPQAPVKRWTRPLQRFLQIESASGFLLLGCTALALLLANIPATSEAFLHFWETPVQVTVGGFHVMPADHATLHSWINDGLMVLFFFVVGLEIKREIVCGELSSWKKASLPVFAALGGMVVPALIYFAQHQEAPTVRGWGVPMATDIAFVVGVLALLGPRVPLGLKIMLLSLAIADDIGAVLVIAFAYTAHLKAVWLLGGAAGFGLCYLFNRIGVRAIGIYFIIGIGIWICFLQSGVHPTVAEKTTPAYWLVMTVPSANPSKSISTASAWVGDKTLLAVLNEAVTRVERRGDKYPETPDPTAVTMWQLSGTAREAVSPLERLESSLHPWVSFLIMPIFALANAGVLIQMGGSDESVSLAVATGLFFGKPIGVLLFSFLAVRSGIGELPRGVNWKVMVGAGCLAGIGFTMALFVNGLAFKEHLEIQDTGKLGILAASLASAVVGSIILLMFLPSQAKNPASEADA